MARLGKLPGGSAEESGITVYELPPGQAVCPYPYECGEKEWLLVLEGSSEGDIVVRRESEVDYFDGEGSHPDPRSELQQRLPGLSVLSVLRF